MNRKTLFSIFGVILLVALGACSSGHHTPPAETISATGGTPQSAAVGAAFGTQLVATVMTGTTANSGVSVTFTAPGSGASGSFGSGATTATVTTDSNGHATAPAFTANGTAGSYTVTASASGVSTPANFSLSNTAGSPASIAATGGTPQSAPINSAFTTALAATVEDSDSNPVSGAVVTFTAPGSSGASGTFTGGVSTITATTNSSGVASTTITANGIIGSYTVTASVSGVSGVADFDLTNSAGVAISGNFSFYATGVENDEGPDTYTLAGAIQIASNGTITGEQDYNDGDGFTFPQDSITSGSLSVNSGTGLGTLTLTTNDSSVGVNGVEVFSLSFVNSSHAVINEFDGNQASSGSLDAQTFGPLTSGGIAFSLTGVAGTQETILSLATGGVFSLASNGAMTDGFFDSNVAGTVTTEQEFTGQLNTTVDAFGRGSISVTADGFPVTLYYYVVNSECVRLIDMDTTDSGVGSAFSQGTSTNTFGNISIGQSVFAVNSNSNSFDNIYSVVGQFTTGSGGPAIKRASTRFHPEGIVTTNFNGVGDVNEEGETELASSISGNYFVDTDGYGQLTITNEGIEDVTTLGIYAVDPNINILDPNNPSGGGGALVVELDPVLVGTGVLVPQTDIAAADFSGNYSFVGQVFASPNGVDEFDGSQFDFVGSGTVTPGAGSNTLTGTGFFNDVFELITATQDSPGVSFDATMPPDSSNPGRYAPYQFNFFDDDAAFDFVTYQASGSLLFLFEEDNNGITAGQYQQQTSLTPGAKKPPLKAASRKH